MKDAAESREQINELKADLTGPLLNFVMPPLRKGNAAPKLVGEGDAQVGPIGAREEQPFPV